MHPHLKMIAGVLLALTLSRSEVPAQSPDSGANPKARVTPQIATPPAPPVPPSPIDYFRKLIDAVPAERGKLLEGKSPDHCRVLTNNLRTYLELSPADRERRLRTLELRYYLTPLLQPSATNRAQSLAAVPETYREIVRKALVAWDSKPLEEQKRLLESEPAIRLSSVFGPPMPPMPPMPRGPAIPFHGLASNQIQSADKAIEVLQSYPEAKRQEIIARFERLSGLPEKALPSLPLTAAEREQMEKTLESYRMLAPAQRRQVLTMFKRFAELPPAERRQFLHNAESWQSMSAEDRERWRHLVNTVPPMPPLPPGFGTPLLPPTPPPPGAAIRVAPSTLLTSSNTP